MTCSPGCANAQWRTGHTEPRLLIRDGRTVGMADDYETAAEIVRAVNGWHPGVAARMRAMAEEATLRAKLEAYAGVVEGGQDSPGYIADTLRKVLDGTWDPRGDVEVPE